MTKRQITWALKVHDDVLRIRRRVRERVGGHSFIMLKSSPEAVIELQERFPQLRQK